MVAQWEVLLPPATGCWVCSWACVTICVKLNIHDQTMLVVQKQIIQTPLTLTHQDCVNVNQLIHIENKQVN